MTVFVHSIVIISFKFLFVNCLGPTATLSIVSYLLGDLGQALFKRACHEDVIFTRKSHNCAGTAFVQGDSVGGSKLTEQTFYKHFIHQFAEPEVL